jgi:hypothetical protein
MEKHSLPTPSLKTNRRDVYDWLDMGIKVITLVVAFVAAFQALRAYRKDVDEKIIDQRIKAFDAALSAGGQVVLAQDWQTFESALDNFGVIKHGQVLSAIGAGPAYTAMVRFYNAGIGIWNDSEYTDPIPQDKLEGAFENMAKGFAEVVSSPTDSGHINAALAHFARGPSQK